MTALDRAIVEFDRALRALVGAHRAARPYPAEGVAEAPLAESERQHAAALMRVNHVGEICAQALYQGQALASRKPRVRAALERAAREEGDHLEWSARRVQELGGRTSLLNPLWYLGSFALGLAAGFAGERWNLGFLAETERQVEAHLSGHLEHLPAQDARTRAVVAAMREDEVRHRTSAISLGAAELPEAARQAMRAAAKLMTSVAHRI
jgi:ubiquinone biosynthesis monooxygenase Coq7